MEPDSQTLVISKSEAIVLFEFLSKFSSDDVLEIKAAAEEKVLWHLLAQLEKSLVEPFSNEWGEILTAARLKVEEGG